MTIEIGLVKFDKELNNGGRDTKTVPLKRRFNKSPFVVLGVSSLHTTTGPKSKTIYSLTWDVSPTKPEGDYILNIHISLPTGESGGVHLAEVSYVATDEQ